MGEHKHTPGPWLREGSAIYALVHHRFWKGVELFKNRFYASIQGEQDCPLEEVEANALLILAAPDMFLALEKAKKFADDRGGSWSEFSQMINETLAKAKGDA